MACTTLKVLPKNRVVNDRFEAYCQVVHVNRLITVKPAIDTRLEHRELVKQQKRQRRRLKAARESEHNTTIRFQNEQLMRKILTADSSAAQARNRSTKSVHEDSRLASIARNNLRFQRLESTRMKRVKLQQENESMMKRILAVRPTINVRMMEHECLERGKLLRRRAKHSRNRVLDFSDLTLQAALKGKCTLLPKPPEGKTIHRRQFRKRRRRLRSAKRCRNRSMNQANAEDDSSTVASIVEKIVEEIAVAMESPTLHKKSKPLSPSLRSCSSRRQGFEELESLAVRYSSVYIQSALSAISRLKTGYGKEDPLRG